MLSPLETSNRTAFSGWSNMLYALSQAMSFFVVALSFWYSSRFNSKLEFSACGFFVGLMSKGAGSKIFKLLDSVPEIYAELEDVHGSACAVRLEYDHFRYLKCPGPPQFTHHRVHACPRRR
ncbi:hypothetical protein FIBSPDRAFT_952516 [Athelia psychrophila]|uniref:Uncharacterized protein n=1 Tax=Athelia psychrophila TaxID=1759441 RepID=A0A166LH94_9AGAM|nr:hypothetical protein FIBSPDRAFT_952516 [Fibularhizoctonia sp. CBS 109695]